MPTSALAAGNRAASAAGSVWMTNEAKYRPAASLITVTDDGPAGRGPWCCLTGALFGLLGDLAATLTIAAAVTTLRGDIT